MSGFKKQEGREYWRSLGQLAKLPEYRHTKPEQYDNSDKNDSDSSFSRRNFLALMGASIALAGMAGCRRPIEKIIPYVSQPEEIIPGVPNYYATTMPFGCSSYGLVVECHEGRPTKIEGNPDHPSTMGASNIFIQASILGLYDPDRSKSVRENGRERSFDDFNAFWSGLYSDYSANKGDGLAVVAESFSSPTLARYKKRFLRTFPKANWVTYEPVSDENIFRAVKNISNKRLRPLYNFDKAEIILSLESDFLQTESENIKSARQFAAGRDVDNKNGGMNRLYVVESAYTVTGGMADHRLRLASGRIGEFLIALAEELKKRGVELNGLKPRPNHSFDGKWLSALAEDLVEAKGKSLIVAGGRQPTIVHELAMVINHALGNFGKTIAFGGTDEVSIPDSGDFHALAGKMLNGEIKTLIIIGGNPAYDAPLSLKFAEAMKKVGNTIHFSGYYDETSRLAKWHVPRAHYLESWGDTRAADGTLGVIQPMIEPLFGGIPDTEFYCLLAANENKKGYDITRETWAGIFGKNSFEKQWRRLLHDGVLKNNVTRQRSFRPVKSIGDIVNELSRNRFTPAKENLEIGFYPSNLYDGRFANNGWLQELSDPVTKLAWDNAALISPGTARDFGLKNNDVIKIEYKDGSLEIPVWISPGHSDYSIALALGYGRENGGRVADKTGFNTYLLRDHAGGFFGAGAVLTKTGRRYELANTQEHGAMEGRPIVREADLSEYRESPHFVEEMNEHPPLRSIYADYDYSKGYQWGMVIDLNACIGCNGCTIACQSENNIPIVGKKQVAKGREMQWIRNDRYYNGDLDDPDMVHQPVACQQCENAPCEEVCPVAATSHDKEGLNTMNYNRCIGTRYCSNNCPYKVRRFNFFNYVNEMPEVMKMVQNPDVTVRSRGVMEKCTFCIQRLNRAKQTAKKEGRVVNDGEIMTACQQTCPTNAIQFGNINDPKSKVAVLKTNDRNYELLSELNIRPRNSYLAKIRNRNPKLKG